MRRLSMLATLYAATLLLVVGLRVSAQAGEWENIGGVVLGEIVSVTVDDHVFLAVRGADDGVYVKWFDGDDWQPDQLNWYSLGGDTNEPPALSVSEDGQIAVIIREDDTRGIHARIHDGDEWGSWTIFDEPSISPPNALWIDERLITVMIDEENEGSLRVYHEGQWSPSWDKLGTAFEGQVTLTALDDETLLVMLTNTAGIPFVLHYQLE